MKSPKLNIFEIYLIRSKSFKAKGHLLMKQGGRSNKKIFEVINFFNFLCFTHLNYINGLLEIKINSAICAITKVHILMQ